MLRAAGLAIGLEICALLAGVSVVHAQAAPTAQAGEAPDKKQVEEMARQHFQLGRTQYDAGAFADAAASFEQAYALSKREVLWYNIYLAHRDAGNNKQAAIALRNYLERVPELENRAQLEARLVSLDRIVAEEDQRERDVQAREAAERQAAAAEPQAAPTPIIVAREAPAAKREESPSIVPFILMGVGGAMVIGGAVTGVMASSKHSELEKKCGDGPCDASLKPLADQGKTLALTTDLLMFGGLAVAATGGVLWFLNMSDDSPNTEQPVRAALSCGAHECNGRIAMSF